MTERLDAAIRLSMEMLQQLEQGDWSRLDELDRQRQPLIHACFDRGEATAEGVAELKDINDRIVDLLAQQRQQTRDRQLRMHQGNQAVRAYLDNE